MMALVSSDELAKDVTGAEALLERHQVGCLTVILRLTRPDQWVFGDSFRDDLFLSLKDQTHNS